MSRRDFLAKAGGVAAGAMALTAGVNLSDANASDGLEGLPEYNGSWREYYKKLDPEAIREKAYKNYLTGMHCGESTFAALTEALGFPFNEIPTQTMWFGLGGVSLWGTTCGTLLGTSAVVSLILGRSKKDTVGLLDELMAWYSTEPLPFKKNSGQTKSVSGSPLCHVSVTKWSRKSGNATGSKARGKRCARLAGDVAAKTAELLNAKLIDGKFNREYALPGVAEKCTGCHSMKSDFEAGGFTHGKMDCESCHEDAHMLD